MCHALYSHPLPVNLLTQAKQTPEDDTPRLVLADWLEEHGDETRAEFIRLGVQHRSKSSRTRQAELEGAHGGCWLGPLWRQAKWPTSWHRGLLTVGLPLRQGFDNFVRLVPWVDTVVTRVPSRQELGRLGGLLAGVEINHLYLTLRPPVREASLLALLAALPSSPLLRSLTVDWPLGLTSRGGRPSHPTVSPDFFGRLVGELAVGRHLTHLGSWPALANDQADAVRSHRVEPVAASKDLWMHATPPPAFRARRLT